MDGNGKWVTANNWWNGSANQSWTDGNDAAFGNGSGVAGNYTVTNNTALLQPLSITFTNPGSYTITTDDVMPGQLSWIALQLAAPTASRGLSKGTLGRHQRDRAHRCPLAQREWLGHLSWLEQCADLLAGDIWKSVELQF